MKTLSKILAITVILLGFSASTFAQSSASSTTTATLLAPLNISKTTDLNFGSLASSGTIGTAEIDPFNNNLAVDGGVTDPGTIAHTNAVFSVTGIAGTAITLSVTGDPVTLSYLTNDLTAATFSYSFEVGAKTLFSAGGNETMTTGTCALTVGAILTVPANSPAGVYNSDADFEVSVDFQ